MEVLKEIRDGVKGTNVRLETVESRLQFVEKRLTNGFKELSEKIETVAARQTEAEIRVATELVSVGSLLGEARAAIIQKLDNHKTVLDHEKRISSLEKRGR